MTGEDTGDVTEYDFVPIKMFVLDRDVDDERVVVLVSSDLNVFLSFFEVVLFNI